MTPQQQDRYPVLAISKPVFNRCLNFQQEILKQRLLSYSVNEIIQRVLSLAPFLPNCFFIVANDVDGEVEYSTLISSVAAPLSWRELKKVRVERKVYDLLQQTQRQYAARKVFITGADILNTWLLGWEFSDLITHLDSSLSKAEIKLCGVNEESGRLQVSQVSDMQTYQHLKLD